MVTQAFKSFLLTTSATVVACYGYCEWHSESYRGLSLVYKVSLARVKAIKDDSGQQMVQIQCRHSSISFTGVPFESSRPHQETHHVTELSVVTECKVRNKNYYSSITLRKHVIRNDSMNPGTSGCW